MLDFFITGLRTLNDLLAAGIAITAFSLLLYTLSFNLRDRVTRSFTIILVCVVVVFVGESLASVTDDAGQLEYWLRVQWLGIIFLPAAYLHLSDALLATTGRPSRGRRRKAVRLVYLLSTLFLIALPLGWLVGSLVQTDPPAPYLQRTQLTWVFAAFYISVMVVSGINFVRAYRRTVARASRRRMSYLLAGALAPALGSYPYLLFGAGFAARHTLTFWLAVTLSNLLVSALLILMAYSVAFFGVSWPDRVVKRRLFKWLMRGPVTASTVLAITTLIRRTGNYFGIDVSAILPVIMVASILIMEHLITLAAPIWERRLFFGKDRQDMALLQTLEERLLTVSDLRQFLEAVLAAVCDRLQTPHAFVAAISRQGVDMLVTIGGENAPDEENLSVDILQAVAQNGRSGGLFSWGEYWLVPLYHSEGDELMGLMGILRQDDTSLDDEEYEAVSILSERAILALEDRHRQQQAFSSLEELTPEIDMIQRLRAAARYDGTDVLTATDISLERENLPPLVKDALSHYWGGPKLTRSPLLDLQVVQQTAEERDENPTNALRAILKQAIEHVRPEGERRFTAEWILYNILDLKFMEGRKVREIAMRLAVSEADLYRKQRVAIEEVANAIVEMEQQARLENPSKQRDKETSKAESNSRWV
jgi:hypothetical protein